jgi:gamma-glutamyltranspeptidase/glutathione hydrolase
MFYLDERHANSLLPGKRPRTTLTPSLALRDGQPWLAIGTPGGDQQDQWALQFFLNVVDFGMDLQEALDAPTVQTRTFRARFTPTNRSPEACGPSRAFPVPSPTSSPPAATESAWTARGATARYAS